MSEDIRYARVEDVAQALDRPDGLAASVQERALRRLSAATDEFVRETKRAFHPVRRGDPDKPRTWESHDARNASRSPPVVINLNRSHVLPIDPAEGDTLAVRVGQDTFRDVTDREGDGWVLDYRRGQVKLFRHLVRRTWFERPDERFVRVTYRHGPLGMDTTVTDSGFVEGVPADVRQAVANRAAQQLVLNDEQQVGIPDDGQVTSREAKAEQFGQMWRQTLDRYTDIRVV